MNIFIGKIGIRSIVIVLFLLLYFQFAYTQTSDDKDIIQQAQQGIFTKMTPDQIRAKLKEYGLTESEAIQKAREKNIDLEQYLQQGTQGTLQTTQAPAAVIPPAIPAPLVEEIPT